MHSPNARFINERRFFGTTQSRRTASKNTSASIFWPKYMDPHTHTHSQTAHSHTCSLAQGLGKHCAACSHLEQAHSFSDKTRVVRFVCCCWRKLLQSFPVASMCVCVRCRIAMPMFLANGNANEKAQDTTWMAKSKNKVTQFQLQINAHCNRNRWEWWRLVCLSPSLTLPLFFSRCRYLSILWIYYGNSNNNNNTCNNEIVISCAPQIAR